MDLRAASRKYGDVLLAGVLAMVFVVETLAYGGDLVSVAAAVLASAALTVRRRLPVVGLLVVLASLFVVLWRSPASDGESIAFVAIFLIAHYSVGRWAGGLEAWVGVVCVVASICGFAIGDAVDNDVAISDISAGSVGFAVFFVGGPWAAGLAIRLRRQRESELDAENDRLRREQEEQAARAVAEERSRIARELHDVVSHAISVTVLQARGARRTLTSDPDGARKALDAIEQTNTAALGDMRRLLAVLRDTEPEGLATDNHAPQPSLAHLEQLVTHVRDSGVPVEVEVVDAGRQVLWGALTNVLKHADQARARVVLDYRDDALEVTVTDDGLAGPVNGAPPGGGHGLIGIRERVAVVGGAVTAEPGPDGGFEIRAVLPYALEVS